MAESKYREAQVTGYAVVKRPNDIVADIMDRFKFFHWRNYWKLRIWRSVNLYRTQKYTLHSSHSQFGKWSLAAFFIAI